MPSETWYLLLTASVMGAICGALFILRRLSDWQPVESIIKTSMKKHLQQEFVNELVQVRMRTDTGKYNRLQASELQKMKAVFAEGTQHSH